MEVVGNDSASDDFGLSECVCGLGYHGHPCGRVRVRQVDAHDAVVGRAVVRQDPHGRGVVAEHCVAIPPIRYERRQGRG